MNIMYEIFSDHIEELEVFDEENDPMVYWAPNDERYKNGDIRDMLENKHGRLYVATNSYEELLSILERMGINVRKVS